MKIILAENYIQAAKKKGKKKGRKYPEYDPNPWAVCHTTVEKDENPKKYERCVKKVKQKATKKTKK